MRKNLREKSFIRWRKRIDGRKTKHSALMKDKNHRFKSNSLEILNARFIYNSFFVRKMNAFCLRIDVAIAFKD